ncbi:Ig-like domain-containing protein [Caballeronia sp. KNU42]
MANQAQNSNQATIRSVGTAIFGGTANSAKPAIVGTAEPHSSVEIFDGVRLIGTAGAEMYGNWTFAPPSNMSSGVHQFTALAIDATGASGQMSTPVSASIPVVAPVVQAPPVIESVIGTAGTAQGNVPSGGTTEDARPTISGTGIPGDTVYVFLANSSNYGGQTYGAGDTVVDASGHWSIRLNTGMPLGLNTITATQFAPGAAQSAASAAWAVTVAASTPATPAAPTLTDDNSNAIHAGSATYDAHPHINGTGVAGDIIKVYDGSAVLGSTTIGSNGQWTFTPANLPAGSHSINVTETNAAGTSSAHSVSTAFSVDPSLIFPAITSIADSVGPIQGNIAQGGVTDDPRPVFHGTGVPGDVVTVGDGWYTILGSVVINASGQWTFQPAANLSNGIHSVVAIGKLAGSWSGVWNFTVDTTTPATPAAPTLTDDNGAAIPAGTTTNDNHPRINGTGKAGDIITVYDGSTLLGSTTIGTNGKWTFTPGNLPVGSHAINVTETNAAGTASAHSGSIGFTYSNLALPPVITNVVDAVGPVQGTIPNNGVTDDSHPTVSGTGTAGNTVYIFQNGSSCGSAIVDATGHWSVTISGALSNGVHAMSATQFASGQDQSASSNTWTITIDTTTPAAPAAPTLTDDHSNAIAAGSTTYDAHPHINGTGVAGDIIKVYDGSTLLGSTTVGTNGQWTFTPANLPAGSHSINVTETNAAGTSSAHSASTAFSVDPSLAIPAITSAVDSVGPIQGNIAQGGVSDDSRPVFYGTGVPGDVVTVWDNWTNPLGSVVVNASGRWAFQPATNLSNGEHYAVALGKLVPGWTVAWNFTVDTSTPATPAAPTLTNDNGAMIWAGSATADAHPHINGTGKAGDLIKVYDNGTAIGSVTVGSDGKWSFTPSADLSDGAHRITVVDVNLAGTSSAASAATSVVIMTGTPATPAAPTLTDDNSNTIPTGSTTYDAHPHINGTGVAGDIIKVYDGSALLGSTTIGSNGQWTFTPVNLPAGSHSINVTETNAAGTSSAHSASATFSVDSSMGIPAITSVFDSVGPIQGNIAQGGVSDDPRPVFYGTGLPGDVVTVWDNYTNALGSAVVNASGRWAFQSATNLADKSHTIVAVGKLVSGWNAGWNFTVDTSTPATPAAPTLTNDNGAMIWAGSATADAHPHINGTGKAGDLIKVYDNGTAIGSVTVGSDGKWSFTPSADLSDGAHRITVVDVNLAGTSSAASAATSVVIMTGTPATPAAPTLTDDNSNTIPTGSTTYDAHPHINGTGVAGDIIKVYDGSALLGSTTIGSNGQWTFTPVNLPAGSHSINVTETNAAGTSSAHSASTAFSVDPSLIFPAITSIADSVGPIQGNIAHDGVTDDPRPVFHGTGVPGDVVTIADGWYATLGSVVVNASGQWTLQPAANLSNGIHSVIALGKLAGTWSGVWNFTVDTTVPVTPAVPTLTDDNGAAIPASTTTTDAHPNISGKGAPSNVIKVYDGSTLIGSTTVDSSGHWTFKPSSDLASGSHSISITEIAPSGTSSSSSAIAIAVGKVFATFDPAVHANDSSQAALVGDANQSATQTNHHTVVGEHDAFVGKLANGNETVDLNADPASYFKESTAHIQGAGGSAIDTLHLSGGHQVLDLSSLTGQTAAAKISGIEAVDLGGQHNALKLSLTDVLNLGETDLFQKDGKQQMMVQGKEGDTVDLSNTHIAGLADGEWAVHGTAVVGGATYNVYEHSGAHTELLVQQGVQVALHN